MDNYKTEPFQREPRAFSERYVEFSGIVGYLVGIIAFFATWIYFIANNNFLLGFCLGWIPSAFVYFITAYLIAYIWPLIALAVIWAVGFLVGENDPLQGWMAALGVLVLAISLAVKRHREDQEAVLGEQKAREALKVQRQKHEERKLEARSAKLKLLQDEIDGLIEKRQHLQKRMKEDHLQGKNIDALHDELILATQRWHALRAQQEREGEAL